MKHLTRFREPFLVLTIGVAVLAPSIPITSTFFLRPEIVMAGILFIWLLPSEGLTVLKSPIFKWLGLLAGMIMLSLGYSVLVIGRPIILRDTFEVVKVGVYAVIFYAAYAGMTSSVQFTRAYAWILAAFLASAAIGIMQYLNFLGINQYLMPLYLPSQPERLITGRRVIGTVGNPNHFGMLMLFGVCLALAGFLWARSARQRWLSAICVTMCAVAMLLAASRTVLAIAALPVLFITIRFAAGWRDDRGKFSRIGLVALALLAATVLMLLVLPSTWFARMDELLNILESESMVGKFANWRAHWQLYLQSPIFGLGPAKGLINLNVDNEWLLFMVRYGVGGVVSALMFGISLFVASNNLVREAPSPDSSGFGIALQAFLLAAPLYMLTAAIYHHQQLMAILLLMVGLGQGARRSLEIKRQPGPEETALAKA